MSHKGLIGSTNYGISGGSVLINGTGYSISEGKTLINGTVQNVPFSKELVIYDGGDTVMAGTLEYFLIGASLMAGVVNYYRDKKDYIPVTEDDYIYTELIQSYAAQGYGYFHIMGIDFTQYSQLHFTFAGFYGGTAGYSTEGLYGPSDGKTPFYNPIYEDSVSWSSENPSLDVTLDISSVTGEKCLMFNRCTVIKIWLD